MVLTVGVFAYARVRRQPILFLSAYPPVKILVEWLSRLHPYAVMVVHHGELAGLMPGHRARYTPFVRRYFAWRRNPRLVDIFLSQGIARNACRLMLTPPPAYRSVLHPCPPTAPRQGPRSGASGANPAVGYFGTLIPENAQRLQRIVQRLAERRMRLGREDFRLRVIAPEADQFELGGISSAQLIDTTRPLSTEEFDRAVASFDLVVLPYEAGQYDLIASSVASDCLRHGIHFLAARSAFFTDWIEANPGAGTLFTTFDALLDRLGDLDTPLGGRADGT